MYFGVSKGLAEEIQNFFKTLLGSLFAAAVEYGIADYG